VVTEIGQHFRGSVESAQAVSAARLRVAASVRRDADAEHSGISTGLGGERTPGRGSAQAFVGCGSCYDIEQPREILDRAGDEARAR
jgi:hypothetical protein